MRQKKKANKKKLCPPSIFQYSDFRNYLRDYMEYRKKKNPSFSYRSFVIQAGVKSHAHLHMVIQGKRQLTREVAKKYLRVLKLNGAEEIYFLILTSADNSAKTRSYVVKNADPVIFDAQIIISLVLKRNFRPDPEWISEKTNGFLSATKAKRALKFILENKWIDVKGGNWSLNPFSRIHTKLETKESFLLMDKFSSDIFQSTKIQSKSNGLLFAEMNKEAVRELESELADYMLRRVKKLQSKKKNVDPVYSFYYSFAEIIPSAKKKYL